MFQCFVSEESAARACVDGSKRRLHHTEALLRNGLVFAEDNDSSRPHMFLFADDGCDAFLAIIGERFVGMFEKVFVLARLRRRHCRWQVDEPLGIASKATHDLKRSNGIFFRIVILGFSLVSMRRLPTTLARSKTSSWAFCKCR